MFWRKKTVEREIAGFRADLNQARAEVARLSAQINQLHYSGGRGSRATYVGDGRLLVAVCVHDNHFAFYLQAQDRLIAPWFFASGAYETRLTNYFFRNLRPHHICIDAGANFGFFTVIMARLCHRGRVIGIEADPVMHALFRDNIAINGCDQVATALCRAVADGDRDVTLHRRHGRSGNTSIAKAGQDLTEHFNEPPSAAFSVPGITIDALSASIGPIDFLKVDIEGAEPLAWSGMQETIARSPAIRVVMEWSPGQIRAAGLDPLAMLGDIERFGLQPSLIGDDGQPHPVSMADVAGLDYRDGIEFSRRG